MKLSECHRGRLIQHKTTHEVGMVIGVTNLFEHTNRPEKMKRDPDFACPKVQWQDGLVSGIKAEEIELYEG